MELKDQLRMRMDQLGVTVPQLAKRIGVSHQAIRHYLDGRSRPRHEKIALLEQALSMRLDLHEGNAPAAPTAEDLTSQEDVALFLLLMKLPASVKVAMAGLAQSIITPVQSPGRARVEMSRPMQPFLERPAKKVVTSEAHRKTRKQA